MFNRSSSYVLNKQLDFCSTLSFLYFLQFLWGQIINLTDNLVFKFEGHPISIEINVKNLFIELDVLREGCILQNVDFSLFHLGCNVGGHLNWYFDNPVLHFFALYHLIMLIMINNTLL